ncbi:MAG: vWA domain-containing protein, partial [Polyangiaceae bacterium]
MRIHFLGLAAIVGLCACSSSSAGGGTGAFADNSTASGGGGGGITGGAMSKSPGTGGDLSLGGGSGGGSAGGGGTGSTGSLAPIAAGGASTGTGTTGLGIVTGASDAGTNAPAAGVLTAGVWDDNLNYSFFSAYSSAHATLGGNPGFTSSDLDTAHAKFQQRSANAVIDAALVIDTTGSMADELSYLTAEFGAISGAISAKYPDAQQRWALVVYRDTPDTDPGDAYVVKSYDFTTDMQAFTSTVGMQSAANGGDYPESPEQGLDALPKLSWRTTSGVAKMAFWVADAPQHTYRAAQMKQAILDVQGAGVHVYPVSASGTDDLLELTMRTTAVMTGGRYLFLTDDSGVGDTHKIPE